MKATGISRSGVSARAFVVGVLLVIVNAYWVGLASELWYAVYTLVNPFSNAVFTLVSLLALNAAFKRWTPRLAFTTAEILLVYVMTATVSTISGHAMMAILMGTLAHPFWFASPENQYDELFHRFIPAWMTVRDPALMRGYFEGDSSLYRWEHLRAWMRPVLIWSAFLFALWSSTLAFALLFRRQWEDHERLTFPLTQLPIQMASNRTFWTSSGMWTGFGVAAFIRIVNALGDVFPALPHVPPNLRIDQHIVDRPWNAIGYVSLSFNPAIVGLAFLMPLDLAFSCWFFFWLARAERILASAVGWQNLHLDERAMGAWVGVAVLALWSARRHLARTVRHVFCGAQIDDSAEPIPYRRTYALLGASLAGVFAFCLLAGMPLWTAVAWYGLFFAFALGLTHVRAGLGPPYHEVIGINPRILLVETLGTRRLGGNALTMLTMFYAFDRCHRSAAMPVQAESIRIGEKGGVGGKPLLAGILLATGVGAAATFWTYLHTAYEHGATARFRGWVGQFGWEAFNPLQRWMLAPSPSDGTAIAFMGGGFAFVMLLHAVRTQWLWFPLHASGYVLSGAAWGGMVYFWFPVMVSWGLKLTILKLAGLPTYRKAQTFFLGLVLGDFLPRSVLSVLSIALNVYMPSSGAGHSL